MSRLETQEARLAQWRPVDSLKQSVERRLIIEFTAAVDIAVTGAVLERNAPAPASRISRRSRIGQQGTD